MTTFDELSQRYSSQIRAAASENPITKSAGYLTESEKRQRKQQNVAAILKQINEDLKQYTIDGKPLSEDQKSRILKSAAEILGLKRPEALVLMIKEASNDNFVALANYWATFFAELKL